MKVTQEIWRVKIPLKIKVFLWYLKMGVILTKDNLAKGIGMVVRLVNFVVRQNLPNTYSLIVTTLNFYGVLLILFLESPHLRVVLIY